MRRPDSPCGDSADRAALGAALMAARRGLYGRRMAQRDWVEWHRDYDDPGSLLSRRGNSCRGICAPSSTVRPPGTSA